MALDALLNGAALWHRYDAGFASLVWLSELLLPLDEDTRCGGFVGIRAPVLEHFQTPVRRYEIEDVQGGGYYRAPRGTAARQGGTTARSESPSVVCPIAETWQAVPARRNSSAPEPKRQGSETRGPRSRASAVAR